MAISVPFGFGNARFAFTLNDEEEYYIDAPINHNSFPMETEVKQEFVNVYGDYKKIIKGYRYTFDVTIAGESIGTTQTAINNFLYYYRALNSEDKSFYFYPHYASAYMNDIDQQAKYLVYLESWSLSNVQDNSVKYGQYLNLKMKTRDLFVKQNYDNADLVLRQVSTGNFVLHPSSGAGGGGGIPYGANEGYIH